jgi:hypothetical protein
MESFVEKLCLSNEDLANNDKAKAQLTDSVAQFISGDKKNKNRSSEPDVFGFLEYLMGKEMKLYMDDLLPKATKKKPLSFERLNMIVMPLIQFLESNKIKTEQARVKEVAGKWLDMIESHEGLNLNTQFET